jgi:hypothetical protein
MAEILTASGMRETSGPRIGSPDRPGSPMEWLRKLGRFVRRPPPIYLVFLLVVVAAIAAVEAAYLTAPVPPGTDSGHWITTAYSYIGWSHPSDFTVQAGLYPPVTFLLVGAVVLGTGSPTTAGFVMGALLLLLYGLTSIHLARRFLKSEPAQLLFVGLAVLNGTTLQMLFWGGYPNFLAFSILNETMVFLLAFVRTRGTWEGIAFWSLAALLYLTHDLSFAILAAGATLGLFLILLSDWSTWRLVRTRGMIAGVLLFLAAVGAYLGITSALGITHPGYLFTNPATYVVDPIGLLFRPFYFAPAFFPRGGRGYYSSAVALDILILPALTILVGAAAAVLLRPGWVPRRLLLVTGWLSATLLLPAAGFLAHIDTDFTRFAFFLPLPVALGACLFAEVGLTRLRQHRARAAASGRSSPHPVPPPLDRPARLATWLAVGIALLALYAAITVPTVGQNETENTTPAHDAGFLQAMSWFNHHGPPGAVLTDTSDSQRWVEAMTARNAFASTSTWLHFYTQQIVDNDLTYWALNGDYVTTDNLGSFAFSGPNATSLDAFPQYVVYVEGIPYPVLRLSMASLTVMVQSPNGTFSNSSSASWGEPSFTVTPATPTGAIPTPSALRIAASFTTPSFWFNVSAAMDGGGPGPAGDGLLNLTVTPAPGDRIVEVTFALRSPVLSTLGGTGNFQGFRFSGRNVFTATEAGAEGSLPSFNVVDVTGVLSQTPDPARSFTSPRTVATSMILSFDAAGGPFSVTIGLNTTGLSNPAVSLPPYLSSQGFLLTNQVRYLLAQNTTAEAPSVALFEQEFGYSLVYGNSQWEVLEA